jgi:hypothetical protein
LVPRAGAIHRWNYYFCQYYDTADEEGEEVDEEDEEEEQEGKVE